MLAFCLLDDVANKEFFSNFSYYTQKTMFIFAYANIMYRFLFVSCLSRASRHRTDFGLFIRTELEDRRLVTGQNR